MQIHIANRTCNLRWKDGEQKTEGLDENPVSPLHKVEHETSRPLEATSTMSPKLTLHYLMQVRPIVENNDCMNLQKGRLTHDAYRNQSRFHWNHRPTQLIHSMFSSFVQKCVSAVFVLKMSPQLHADLQYITLGDNGAFLPFQFYETSIKWFLELAALLCNFRHTVQYINEDRRLAPHWK